MYYVIRETSHKKNTIWLSIIQSIFISPMTKWDEWIHTFCDVFHLHSTRGTQLLEAVWICGVCVRGRRGVREEWRHGLLPNAVSNCLMGLNGTSDHSEVAHGWVNLGAKFPEENEFGWNRMNGRGYTGSSRHLKRQWRFVLKSNFYLSVNMESYELLC